MVRNDQSSFKKEQIGWIGAVARRYGRPVFAFIDGNKIGDADAVLDLLSRTQLYWWTSATLAPDALESFRFVLTNDWK